MSKTTKIEKDYDDYDEVMRYLIDELDSNEDITLLVDYAVATDLAEEFKDEDFDNYYGVSIASDCGEYLVSKCGNESFIIEPAKHCGIYYDGEHDKLIVLEELMSDEFIDRQEYKELEIVCIDNECEAYDEDEEGCNCDECCNCCGCNDEAEGDEKYIIELILSYLELIKDNDYKDEAILQAFMEVLEKLGIIEIED